MHGHWLPCPRHPATGGYRACPPAVLVQRRPRHDARKISAPPARRPSRTKSSKSAPKMSLPSSANPFKALAASSSRLPITGLRSRRSAANMASCWSVTRSSAASGAPAICGGTKPSALSPTSSRWRKGLSSGYLPISAVAVSADIIKVMKTGGDFVHGYTYSGHPVCAAVALRNIEIMEREAASREAHEMRRGRIWRRHWRQLNDHSTRRRSAQRRSARRGRNRRRQIHRRTLRRGKEGTAGPMVRDHCIANGLMVRGIRDSIVMCPPLIMTTAQIDESGRHYPQVAG